jgi:DNA-binding transcriptional LysR family regulator
VRRIKRSAQEDALTVSVAPFFSARWLTPRLGRWWQRHPTIDLQLRHAYQPADFLHDRVDAGISWGHGDWPEADAIRVLTGELVAVCSPAVARKTGRKLAPAGLLGERLFCEFDVQHWQRWFEAAGVALKRKLDVVRIDDSHALRQTAIDGHGHALFFRGLVQEDLRSGLLVQPFDACIDPGSAYYLVRPRRKPVGPHLAAFSVWLLDEVSDRPFV